MIERRSTHLLSIVFGYYDLKNGGSRQEGGSCRLYEKKFLFKRWLTSLHLLIYRKSVTGI